MEVEHADPALAKMETDLGYNAEYSVPIVKQFRRVMQLVRLVDHEAQLYQFNGRRFKQLQPPRQHQHSMRLNKKWRLIVEVRGDGPEHRMVVVGIENHYED
jgi:proteic killer suppression protein